MRFRRSAASTRLRPDPLRPAVVLVGDDRAELLHPSRHRARESVDSRPLAEDLLEARRVHGRDCGSIEPAYPVGELLRARERGRHRHLLVEREADEEGERLAREELVGRVRVGEVEGAGTP